MILFTLVIATAAHFVLSSTRFGREIYATGGNPIAATLSGIRSNRVIIAAYMISGVAAALGGLMITARLEAGERPPKFGMRVQKLSPRRSLAE